MEPHSAAQDNSENSQFGLLPTGAAIEMQPLSEVWREGLLFHSFNRYPSRNLELNVDRIGLVLEKGLLAPLASSDNSVQRDVMISVSGLDVPYESYVFIHQFSTEQNSWLYTMAHRDRCFIILSPALEVISQEAMCQKEPNWVVTCADEVYVPMNVAVDQISGIGLSKEILPEVLSLYGEKIQRLGITLYLF